ncbi:OB-fold domain-containing protein [Nonomuraea sp. NPDC049141]|uniref:Zn-ribbon domain-containing OB-fold protein n=1 Tax=unclassified Nonomuraea TaxID=2593643 RepID=UPI0033C7B804
MSAHQAAGLRGSRCEACAVTVYPADDACPRCGRAASPVTLSSAGELWTWTVQRFAPKSPPFVPPKDGFRPFAMGYVELPEGVRVAAVLDIDDLGSIRIGMPLRIEPTTGVPRAMAIEGAS